MKIKLIFILISLNFVYLSVPNFSKTLASSVTEITTSPALHRNPDIYNNRVVFDDRISSRDEVSMYNIATGKTTQLTNSCRDQQHSPKIYDNIVVYVDLCNTSVYSQVYYYNISKGKSYLVGTGEAPSIYKNKIIFSNNTSGVGDGNDIFIYDIDSGKTTQITNNHNGYLNSSMYENILVFDGIPHGHHSKQIYLYSMKNKTLKQITNAVDYVTDDSYPRIFENKVVWEDHTVATNYIHTSLYDIQSGIITSQIDENIYDTSPTIYGDNVVYEDNASQAIVSYNIPSGQTNNVFTGTTTQFLPAIYKNTVVWVGVDPNTSYHEIYISQLSSSPTPTFVPSPSPTSTPEPYNNGYNNNYKAPTGTGIYYNSNYNNHYESPTGNGIYYNTNYNNGWKSDYNNAWKAPF